MSQTAPKYPPWEARYFMLANTLAEVNSEVLKSDKNRTYTGGTPNEQERAEYIQYLLKDNSVAMDISVHDFAKLSSGLFKKP